MKKPLPPTYLLAAIVLIVLLHFLWPVARILPFPWNLVGIIPVVIGLTVTLVADQSFKKHETTVKPFEESSALVTDGVFRISRNPMYLGFVLLLCGIVLLFGSITPIGVVVVFAVLMDVVFIRVEEHMLREKFGEEWEAYRRRVRRWL